MEDELRARPQEDRDILVVALGKELASDAWLADHARRSPVNRIRVVELRSDPRYGGFFEQMIDTSHDGEMFHITLADIPERRADLVEGAYEVDVPTGSTVVAVRITDMLGDEVLVVLPVTADA